MRWDDSSRSSRMNLLHGPAQQRVANSDQALKSLVTLLGEGRAERDEFLTRQGSQELRALIDPMLC